jgi:hypothetical protein
MGSARNDHSENKTTSIASLYRVKVAL